MSESDLRARIKEMLVKNLMLQTTPDQIGDDLPLFGPNGLGLDSIDALELAASNDLHHQRTELHNSAIGWRCLPPGEPRKPDLVFHATVEPAPELLRLESPRAAHKSARRSLHPQPILARHVVDFRRPLQRRRNRAGSLHRRFATLTFSRPAAANEQAAAKTE